MKQLRLLESTLMDICTDTEDKKGNKISKRDFTDVELMFIARKGTSKSSWRHPEAKRIVLEAVEAQTKRKEKPVSGDEKVHEMVEEEIEREESITLKVIDEVTEEEIAKAKEMASKDEDVDEDEEKVKVEE